MSTKILVDYYNPTYTREPCYTAACGVNELYKTLPHPETYPWEVTAAGPASIKHLYTGVPNWYPIQKIARPVGTMYEHEFEEVTPIFNKRLSYHWKVYPFQHRHAREVRVYKDQILPYMDNRNWTRHAVRRDASLNNPTGALQL